MRTFRQLSPRLRTRLGPGALGNADRRLARSLSSTQGPLLRGEILPGGGDWEIVRVSILFLNRCGRVWPAEVTSGADSFGTLASQDHPARPGHSFGDETQQTAHLDTRYNLQTHDGAVIYLQTTGTRTGPKSVLEQLGKGNIGAVDGKFRMRLHCTMETGDERYAWLNEGVFIASSGRVGDQVIYDCYQLL